MARILICWELGSGFGHLRRLKPIADKLKKNGHTILWAVKDSSRLTQLIKQDKKSFFSFRKADQVFQLPRPNIPASRLTLCFAHILTNMGYCDPETLDRNIESWLELFNASKADIIVTDLSPTGILAAHIVDIPVIDISNGWSYPDNKDISGLLVDKKILKKRYGKNLYDLKGDEQKVLKSINTVLHKRQIQGFESLDKIINTPKDRFIMNFAELDHFGPRNLDYFGMQITEGIKVKRTHDIHILLYLQNFPALEEFLMYIKTLPYQFSIFMTHPRIPEKLIEASQQDNIRFFQGAIDFHSIKESADYFVGNGNLGTTALSLWAGLPMVCIPLDFEKAMVAEKVVSYGAGLIASADNFTVIKHAFLKILDNKKIIAKAKQFSEKYETYSYDESLENIILRIEKVLTQYE